MTSNELLRSRIGNHLADTIIPDLNLSEELYSQRMHLLFTQIGRKTLSFEGTLLNNDKIERLIHIFGLIKNIEGINLSNYKSIICIELSINLRQQKYIKKLLESLTLLPALKYLNLGNI